MAQEFFAVQEDNDLGIGKVVDPLSVHDQQCPVPPVLDHQLDVLMIVEMIKMKNAMLESMRRMIEDRRRNNWYEVYLTMFVLLSNLQYVFQKQQRYQKLHYGTVRLHPLKIDPQYADLEGTCEQYRSSCQVVQLQIHAAIPLVSSQLDLALPLRAERSGSLHTGLVQQSR